MVRRIWPRAWMRMFSVTTVLSGKMQENFACCVLSFIFRYNIAPISVEIVMFSGCSSRKNCTLSKAAWLFNRYASDIRYTDVYVKRKGRWLLASEHVSNVAGRR